MNTLFSNTAFCTALKNVYKLPFEQIQFSCEQQNYTVPLFKNKNEAIVGLLFEKSGIPMIEHNYSDVLNEITEYTEKANFNSLRLFSSNRIAGLSNLSPNKVNMVLDLPDDPEALWKSLKPKVRSQVRRPKREGYSHTLTHTKEDLDKFYAIYQKSIHSIGSLHLPYSFFEEVFNSFKDKTLIYIGYLNDKPVCTAFLTDCGSETFIPWAGSIREYNKFGINMAMYWYLIKWSIENKKTTFNFGRSTRNQGTYNFKKQWMANEQQLYLYNFPIFQKTQNKDKIYSKINHIIRSSPMFVMELASQLLIRKFY